MLVDVTANGQVDRYVNQPQTTDTLRIQGVFFDFENESAVFDVIYGIGDGENFDAQKRESWYVTGNPLKTVMMMDSEGTTRLDSLRHMMADVAQRLQTNPDLKQSLIDDGHLVVRPGGVSIRGI